MSPKACTCRTQVPIFRAIVGNFVCQVAFQIWKRGSNGTKYPATFYKSSQNPMNDKTIAYRGADIFDGTRRYETSALLINSGIIHGICNDNSIPEHCDIVGLTGGILTAGFVDLQVNGGGGVQLNATQTIDAFAEICEAHAKFGTTSLLPTLITDSLEITAKTARAATHAMAENLAGMIGLHLEGPHLSVARKGAHDPDLIRLMSEKIA